MDPAFPSMPPPPADESIKPMSVIAGCMWAVGAELMYLWALMTTRIIRGEDSYDLIGASMCQAVAFMFVLYLVLRVYAPNSPIRDLIALRSTNPWFFLLAPIIGLSATYPSYQLLDWIHAVWPAEEQLTRWVDVFYTLSMPERVGVAAGIVVLGPFMEEMLFRGALYRPLRIDKSPLVVIGVTAFLFAGVHLDPQRIGPLFLLGLILGYLRWASGSLIPPLMMHMAFNALPVFELMGRDKAPATNEPIPISLAAGGAGVLVLALLFTGALARSSRRASAARRDDK